MLLALALMASAIQCPVGQAATGPNVPPTCAWVPADANGGGCGPTAHRHSMDYDDKGKFVVNKQKGEPDVVFDGECHDNDAEFACAPEVTSKGANTCVRLGKVLSKEK